MGAVSIWELAANSGSSWISQAPNLHFARQLLTREIGLVKFRGVNLGLRCILSPIAKLSDKDDFKTL